MRTNYKKKVALSQAKSINSLTISKRNNEYRISNKVINEIEPNLLRKMLDFLQPAFSEIDNYQLSLTKHSLQQNTEDEDNAIQAEIIHDLNSENSKTRTSSNADEVAINSNNVQEGDIIHDFDYGFNSRLVLFIICFSLAIGLLFYCLLNSKFLRDFINN